MSTRRRVLSTAALTALLLAPGCATLQQAVRAPVLDIDTSRASRAELLAPSLTHPLGGAAIRVWARVQNPNPVGFTLSRLDGTVLLSEQPAADVDLPLGLPLPAGGDTVIPLEVTVSFADLPDLADPIRQALAAGTIRYALRGTLAVDAGALGQPAFGPRTWLSGDIDVTR